MKKTKQVTLVHKERLERSLRLNIILLALCVALITSLGVILYSKDTEVTGPVVFENDKVTIEYIEVNDDIFDVYVDVKEGYNVLPEFEMSDRNFYKDTYLVGMSKDQAQRQVREYKARTKLDWKFNWQDKND